MNPAKVTHLLTPLDVALMEEARQARAMTEIGLTCEQIMGGVMSFLEPGSWANQACGIGLAEPVREADVDRLVDYYVSRGVEPKAELSQFAHLTLINALAERGFTLRQFETVLARVFEEGERVDPEPAGGWPVSGREKLVIERVDPDDEAMVLLSWRVSMSGFLPEPREPTENELDMHRRIVGHAHSDYLIARFGEKVVSAGGAEYPRGDEIAVAVLFGVSVLPEFRQRGIQQAMILERVRRAQDRGAKAVVIHSIPGAPTDRNAMRLGFLPSYTKVIMAKSGEGLTPSP